MTDKNKKTPDFNLANETIENISKRRTSDVIRERINEDGASFHANSNISKFINEGEKDLLINEAAEAFEKVLEALVIDTKNDPNSMDTPRRLAKMYINETMSGRYDPTPKVTSFPNTHTDREDGFGGLLVVHAEIKSMCSHHHQPVTGHAYIGIVPTDVVIGLSKYIRLAQHMALRGTLQEELAQDIAEEISKQTKSRHVGVFIEAEHGCVTNRGVCAHDSTTNTTVLLGNFMTDGTLRKEFHDNIMMQKLNKKN